MTSGPTRRLDARPASRGGAEGRRPALTPPRRSLLRDPRRSRSPLPLPWWIALIAADLLVFWVSVPTFVVYYECSLGIAFLLATVQCAPVPLAARLPWTAVLVQLGALLGTASVLRDSTDELWPLPVPGLVCLVLLLAVLGVREHWVRPVAAWWLSFLALVLAVVLFAPAGRSARDWGVGLLVDVTVTLAAVATSTGIGQRRRVIAVLADARRDVELEQARRHTAEERARIARELHDVVAHSMSIVHIRAESARYRITDVDAARTEFTEIAGSARSALREMRQLLGALRPEADVAEVAPQPSAADVPDLIDGVEAVGHRVTLDGDPVAATQGTGGLLGLTVYRVVQEALSNVVRHAPLADVHVSISRTHDAVVVRVENGAPGEESGAVTRAATDPGGQGLRGMRERAALLGGDVVQRPLPSGGFLIVATLPLQAE